MTEPPAFDTGPLMISVCMFSRGMPRAEFREKVRHRADEGVDITVTRCQ